MRKSTMSVVGAASLVGLLSLTACGGSDAPSDPSPIATQDAGRTAALPSGSSDPSAGPSGGSATSSTPSVPKVPSQAGPTPTVEGLLADTKAAIAAASAVRLKGSIDTDGQTMTVDGASDKAGKSVDLSLSGASTGTLHIVMVGGQTYMRGDDAFWSKAGASAIADKAKGKFVHMPAGTNDAPADVNTLEMAGSIFTDIDASQVDTITSKSVNGVEAWVLTEKGGNGTIAVDKATKLPIMLDGGAKSPGQVTFSDWNTPVNVTAPPADQVVELTALMGG